MPYADIDQLRRVQITQRGAEACMDRDFANLERQQDSFDAAKERAESQVTFNEILKRLRQLPAARKNELMREFEADRRHFLWMLDGYLGDAFETQCTRRARRELSTPRHIDLQDEA